MRTVTSILIALILLVCAYLTYMTFINVGTGGDPGSFKFLIPVILGAVFAVVGIAYIKNRSDISLSIGVVIPLICLGIGFYWNQRVVAEQKQVKQDNLVQHCLSQTKVDRPGYYYYRCDNGSLYIPDEFVQQYIQELNNHTFPG